MKRLKESEFLDLFDPSVHDKILASAARYPDCEGIVCFENQQMDSSAFGDRTACVVGPSNTWTLMGVLEGDGWRWDLPSRRQYPTCYVDYRK